MDLCARCGSPEVATRHEGYLRCDNCATTPLPRDFHGETADEALRRIPEERWERIPFGDMTVRTTPSGALALHAGPAPVRASKDLLAMLRLPAPVLDALGDRPETQDLLLQRLARRAGLESVWICDRDGEIVGVRRGDLEARPLTLRQATTVAFEEFDRAGHLSGRFVERIHLGHPSHCHLLTTARRSMSKSPNDLVAAGVVISVNGATRALPYLRRLICTNGMTSDRTCHHVTDAESDLRSQVRRSIAFTEKEYLESFAKSDDVVVAAPEQALRGIPLPRGLDGIRAEIRRRLHGMRGHLVTAADVTNTVTGLHHFVPESQEALLATAGGRITVRFAARPPRICGHCGRAR